MQATQAYLQGWKIVLQNKRMWAILFGFNFLLALIGTVPVSGYLQQSLGQSLAASKLLEGFNYTLVSDLLNQYGEGIALIMDQSQMLLLAFFLLSVFLMGGILVVFKHKTEFDFARFWNGCFYYFWRLLRLTIYFLLIQGFILFIFGFIFLKATNGLFPFALESDKQVIVAFQWLAPFYLFIACMFFMIQDYAKIHIVEADRFLLTKPLLEVFRIVFKNFGRFALLYILNILTLLVFAGIYWGLSQIVEHYLLLVFIAGQLFILARIVLKLLNLSSATLLYQNAITPV